MIAKILRSEDVKSLMAYLTSARKELTPDHIETQNIINVDLAAEEMAAVAAAATHANRVRRPFAHIILGWRRDEGPTITQQKEVAEKIISKLGLESHQAVVVVHAEAKCGVVPGPDGRHYECHIAVNRVRMDGGVAKLDHEFARLEIACAEVASEMNFLQVPGRFNDVGKLLVPGLGNVIGSVAAQTGLPTLAQELRQDPEVMQRLRDARQIGWPALLAAFNDADIIILPGRQRRRTELRRGLVIVDRHDPQRRIKISAMSTPSESWSSIALEKDLGKMPGGWEQHFVRDAEGVVSAPPRQQDDAGFSPGLVQADGAEKPADMAAEIRADADRLARLRVARLQGWDALTAEFRQQGIGIAAGANRRRGTTSGLVMVDLADPSRRTPMSALDTSGEKWGAGALSRTLGPWPGPAAAFDKVAPPVPSTPETPLIPDVVATASEEFNRDAAYSDYARMKARLIAGNRALQIERSTKTAAMAEEQRHERSRHYALRRLRRSIVRAIFGRRSPMGRLINQGADAFFESRMTALANTHREARSALQRDLAGRRLYAPAWAEYVRAAQLAHASSVRQRQEQAAAAAAEKEKQQEVAIAIEAENRRRGLAAAAAAAARYVASRETDDARDTTGGMSAVLQAAMARAQSLVVSDADATRSGSPIGDATGPAFTLSPRKADPTAPMPAPEPTKCNGLQAMSDVSDVPVEAMQEREGASDQDAKAPPVTHSKAAEGDEETSEDPSTGAERHRQRGLEAMMAREADYALPREETKGRDTSGGMPAVLQAAMVRAHPRISFGSGDPRPDGNAIEIIRDQLGASDRSQRKAAQGDPTFTAEPTTGTREAILEASAVQAGAEREPLVHNPAVDTKPALIVTVGSNGRRDTFGTFDASSPAEHGVPKPPPSFALTPSEVPTWTAYLEPAQVAHAGMMADQEQQQNDASGTVEQIRRLGLEALVESADRHAVSREGTDERDAASRMMPALLEGAMARAQSPLFSELADQARNGALMGGAPSPTSTSPVAGNANPSNPAIAAGPIDVAAHDAIIDTPGVPVGPAQAAREIRDPGSKNRSEWIGVAVPKAVTLDAMPETDDALPTGNQHSGGSPDQKRVRALAAGVAYLRNFSQATPRAEAHRRSEIERIKSICGLPSPEFEKLVVEVRNTAGKALKTKGFKALRQQLWSEMAAGLDRDSLDQHRAGVTKFHEIHQKERGGIVRI